MRLLKRARWALWSVAQATLSTILNLLLHPLARFARRNRRRWVFGHEDGAFAGNPKFLYLWVLQNAPVEALWITGSLRTWRLLRSRGCPVALRWSPWGMYRTVTAGAAFFSHRTSDINSALLNGALLVNLWHGVGLKAIQLGWEPGKTALARRRARGVLSRARWRTYIDDPDFVATTSDFMQAHFAGQFGLDRERCPQIGYPRLDCSVDPKLAASARQFDEPQEFDPRSDRFAEAYIYMPTSRDSRRPLLTSAFPDLRKLESALAQRNAVLYVRLHPRTYDKFPAGLDRIRPWPHGVDFQPRLHEFDALITDYSSVLYDYLAVRSSGAVIYAFDLDEYLERDRTLLYPFRDNVAGLLVEDFDELCAAIGQGRVTAAVDAEKLRLIRERFWGGTRLPASEWVYRHAAAALAWDDRSPESALQANLRYHPAAGAG
jgi:CDP-glycerol glycerophosphotransferase (TagB/SpsB family)